MIIAYFSMAGMIRCALPAMIGWDDAGYCRAGKCCPCGTAYLQALTPTAIWRQETESSRRASPVAFIAALNAWRLHYLH